MVVVALVVVVAVVVAVVVLLIVESVYDHNNFGSVLLPVSF